MGLLTVIIITVIIVVLVKVFRKPQNETSSTENVSIKDAVKITTESTGKYEMTMNIDYDPEKLKKLINKRPTQDSPTQSVSPIKLSDEDVKKVFKGIRIIYTLDKTKSASTAENKLTELKFLLEDMKITEDIKNEYAQKYGGEKWNSFVFRAVNEFQRHKQKYVNETNTPSTLILSAPGQSLKDWDELKKSKLKTKTNR